MTNLTINEAAKKFGISKSNIDKKMRLGILTYTIGDDKTRRVDDAEIQRVFGDRLKKKAEDRIVDDIKGQIADPKKTIELIEAQSKLAIEQAKNQFLEKRVYEIEDMLRTEKEEKKQWQDIANRLSLTFNKSSSGQFEDSEKTNEKAKKIEKKRSLISRLLGRWKGAT